MATAEPQTLRRASDFAVFADQSVRQAQAVAGGVVSGPWAWLLCVVSFAGLQAIDKVGTLGALAFLAPWGLLLLPRPTAFGRAVFTDWAMLCLPLFGTFSTLWSPNSGTTFRTGLEYLATVAVGIAAARCVDRNTLWAAIAAALSVFTAAGVAIEARKGFHGGDIGLYNAHNELAEFSAILMIIGLSYAFFEPRGRLYRAVFFGCGVLGAIGTFVGHSAGTMVALLISIAIVAALRFGIAKRPGLVLAGIVGGLCAAVVLIDLSVSVLYQTALKGMGKDTSLTGRTDLWAEGLHQISQRPFAGTGLAGFWFQGNPPAEVLWWKFHIPGRGGFHFHDTYINVAVDLGVPAAALLLVLVLVSAKRFLRDTTAVKRTPEMATVCIVLFLFVCSFVEAELVLPFNLSTVLFCVGWAQGRRSAAG